jgi:hypothetical protein
MAGAAQALGFRLRKPLFGRADPLRKEDALERSPGAREEPFRRRPSWVVPGFALLCSNKTSPKMTAVAASCPPSPDLTVALAG